MLVKIILTILFLALTVGVGVNSRKHANSVDGVVLGGRSVGPWLTAFAFGTSYFSAVVFVGYAGNFGWNIGVGSMWIGIGNAVLGCLLSWLLFANKTRKMTKKLNAKTSAKTPQMILFISILPRRVFVEN